MASVLYSAVGQGLLWAMVTFGVFVTYRILDFADLSVDGSVALGGAVSAVLALAGWDPLLCALAAALSGAAAGALTALFATKMRIPAILSGILTQIALYSINLRIMGRSNVALLNKPTIFKTVAKPLGLSAQTSEALIGLLAAALVGGLLWLFLKTEKGLAVRATGGNPRMIRALGVNTNGTITLALVLSNAMVGLGGALIAQQQGYADVGMGTGAIVIGLAAVIIGEVIFGRRTLLQNLIAVVLGSVIYRMIIALVMQWQIVSAGDLKLITAILVAAALFLPTLRKKGHRPQKEAR